MQKIILIIVIVAVVLVGGYLLINKSYPVPAPVNVPAQTSQPLPTPVSMPTPAPVPTPSASAPKTWSVTIQNFAFNQPSLTIKKGDTVVWTDKDSAPHTVTVDSDGGPASPTLNTDGTYSFTFNATGTFTYHCSIHPFMHGTVIVQ